MTINECKRLSSLFGKCSYNGTNKESFRLLSRKLLRKVAALMGLSKGTYDIRYNPAGIACSGDATLHGEHIYISLNADCCPWVLVRTCNGQKDYTGGRNCQYPFASLSRDGAEGLAGFASAIVIMGFA